MTMGWNGQSWPLSDLLVEGTILSLARVRSVLVAVGFLSGDVGEERSRDWTTPVLVGAARLSTVVLVVTWNGRFELLVENVRVTLAIDLSLRPSSSSRGSARLPVSRM